MPNNELFHYGIEGQKWGIRRFQNPDGTLTEAGKRRYNGDHPTRRDRAEERKAVREINRDRKQIAKTSAYLSDKEVKEYIDRLKLEKQLRDLTDENRKTGNEFLKKVLKDDVLRPFVNKAVAAVGDAAGKWVSNKMFNVSPDKGNSNNDKDKK